MTVLSWDKPEKVMSTEAWQSISADGAPPGVYVPNMSDEDAAKWKAKVRYAKTDHPQVEIRKTAHGAQMVLIVGLDGWTYKPSGHVEGEQPVNNNRPSLSTQGHQVRLSMNSPAWFTWEEFLDMTIAVHEARKVLQALRANP